MRVRFIAILATMAALVIFVMPEAAYATPPTREPLPLEDFVLSDHCTFDIQVDVAQNKEILTTYYDGDGDIVRQSVTGALKVRLTNMRNGHSMFFNISGPSQTRFLPDGSLHLTATGASIQLYITNLPGELLFVHGPFSATINDEGFFVTQLPHNVQDVCALLS